MRRCGAYLLSTHLPVRFSLQRSISDPFDLNAWNVTHGWLLEGTFV
jgi:hypothetical protein